MQNLGSPEWLHRGPSILKQNRNLADSAEAFEEAVNINYDVYATTTPADVIAFYPYICIYREQGDRIRPLGNCLLWAVF
jgi:hypothetical protein